MQVPGVLVLEDRVLPQGREFPGYLFGAPVSVTAIREKKDFGYGEVVFNTSMTGYQEILTDPSYYGQIICMTVPHIGNTGVNFEDPESVRLWCGGFVVHENCHEFSNWRAQGDLDQYLKSNQIPGLYGVDTRAVTRHLRSLGVVRGIILPLAERESASRLLAELPLFEGRDLISEVSTKKPYLWPSTGAQFKVVAMDLGVKWNLLRNLERLGCTVEVVPASTSCKEILSKKPDGVFLSNGPGDPTAAPYVVETVTALLGQVPIFGVCMGHQILALALGGKTYKLKFGHRGGNQPVLDCVAKHVEISSHNHGYAVDAKSLPKEAEVTHVNLNDRTVEGLSLPEKNAFSVQYHPEACPGPHDSALLFERFVDLMQKFSKGRDGKRS